MQFMWRPPPMQVFVRDNNVEQAMRILKKKMQREGIFREAKAKTFYSKPSELRAKELTDAIRRARKLARKKAEREGLLPKPKPKVLKNPRGPMRPQEVSFATPAPPRANP